MVSYFIRRIRMNPSQMGISVVHQELKLAETLSVTENMFLGNLMYKGKLVDWKGMRKKPEKCFRVCMWN